MHPRPTHILALLASILLSFSSNAQPYNFRNFGLADGLPQSQVWCALSDSRGYLWFGTQGGGLARFDGQNFETFTTADGLPSNFIHAIYQERDYVLWIGTNKGLCRYDGQQFQTIPDFDKQVNAIAQHPDKRLLLATNKGIYATPLDSIALQQWRISDVLDYTPSYCFYSTKNQVWLGAEDGLWNITEGADRYWEGAPVFDIMEDPRGRLWLAASDSGVLVLDPRKRDEVERIESSALSLVRTIRYENVQSILVGTQYRGLVRINPIKDKITVISEAQGLPHNHIRTILSDHQNRLWLTTSGGGISCLLQQNFRHFTEKDGLAGSRVYSVLVDSMGNIWSATSNKGIQKLSADGFHRPLRDAFFRGVKCKTLCKDSLQNIWIGTEGKGVAVLDSTGFHHITSADGLPSDWIVKLLTDREGNTWGATYSHGIFKLTRSGFRDYEITTYGTEEGLPTRRITALQIGKEGRIWFGTIKGDIGFFEEGKVKRVFNSDNGIPSIPVRSLAFNGFRRVWVGTKGDGVHFADWGETDTEFSKLSDIQPMASQNIYLLISDREGNLWAGSENGVDKISVDSLGQVSQVRHYGRDEGFLGIETCHEAATLDPKGDIWFGTMDGLTHYTHGEDQSNCVVPKLYFTDTELFYKPLRETAWAAYQRQAGGIEKGLELPHRQNHLSFGFKAVSQMQPEAIRYRWKLEGADAQWSPASATQSVNYANLPPGEYRFAVQAAVGTCAWSEALSAPFMIATPFWQESWFQGSVFFGSLALIGLFTWLLIRRIKRRERARRAELEMQNKLLQLEQKAAQLQMNPHFIFNALTGIRSLVTDQNYSRARDQINSFAKLMRNILNNSRKPTISLQTEVETLEEYLKIEQFCQRQPFDFHITLDKHIDAEEIELPPMLLQPFLENAVVHGISHLKYPGQILVHFALRDDLLTCTIKDNGVGREKAAKLKAERKPGHQSVAVEVTRERLLAQRGEREYEVLKYSDILNTKGEIAGTEVQVTLPVQTSF